MIEELKEINRKLDILLERTAPPEGTRLSKESQEEMDKFNKDESQ